MTTVNVSRESLKRIVERCECFCIDPDIYRETALRDPAELEPCARCQMAQALAPEQPFEQGDDNNLPGMWSHSDFTGGDPDERSHAEREQEKSVAPLYLQPANDEAVRLLDSLVRAIRGTKADTMLLWPEIESAESFLATHKQEGKDDD